MTSTETSQFRVYFTNEATMTAMRKTRDIAGIKNADLIALALANLGKLQDQLVALGFGKTTGRKAMRLGMTSEQLDHLRSASEVTSVPASDLFLICLAQISNENYEAAPKPAKATKKVDIATKAPRSRTLKASEEKPTKKARKPRAKK